MKALLATDGALENREGLKRKIDLQFFADSGVDETGGEPTDDSKKDSAGGSGAGGDKAPEVTLPKTVEELQKLLQSEADKRVTQAIKTAQEKWQKEYEAKLKAEREEAERLAKLSAEEKEKELLKKQQEEIEKRERAIAQRELELKTISLLQEKKLPIEFKEYVLGEDEATTLERIDKFQKLFRETIQKEVETRLKGKSPRQSEEPMDIDLGKQIAEGRNVKQKKVDLWEV